MPEAKQPKFKYRVGIHVSLYEYPAGERPKEIAVTGVAGLAFNRLEFARAAYKDLSEALYVLVKTLRRKDEDAPS